MTIPWIVSKRIAEQREGVTGGERGIRTLDTLPYTHFPGVRLRPLGHLSQSGKSILEYRKNQLEVVHFCLKLEIAYTFIKATQDVNDD